MNFTIINQALPVKIYSYDLILVEFYLKLKTLVGYFWVVLLRNLSAIPFSRILFSLSQLNSDCVIIYYLSFVVSTFKVT